MIIGILIISVLIFGIYFSKIKIDIRSVEIEKGLTKFNINLGFFVFGKIKVLSVNIFEDGVKFLSKKISYKNAKKIIDKVFKTGNKDKCINKYINTLKAINPKLEELNLKLNVRTEDIFFNIFLIVGISTVLSFFINKSIERYDSRKYKYIVLPYCKKTKIVDLKGKCIISAKMVNIITSIYIIKGVKI